jgi:ribosomal protein S18 acetylase RimI-like enzyme
MFEIRPAREQDALALARISESTFVETFAKDNRAEDMADYVSKTFGAEKQLAEIQDPKRFISLAWLNESAAGFYHLHDGIPHPSVQGSKPIELLRLYISSGWYGKGLGPLLMDKCIEESSAKGFKTLWLSVWEKNYRAQAFYKKYGFRTCGNQIFMLGEDAQSDLILTLSLE